MCLCCLAGLYLLRLPDTSGAVATWQPITATCALAIPDVLCYAPFDSSSSRSLPVTEAEEQEGPQLAGLLFVGSKSSSSQVLGWPCTAGQQQQLTCPVLQSAFMPSLAGAQAVLALQDASGEQQQATGTMHAMADCRMHVCMCGCAVLFLPRQHARG